jgi:hypothetical protein
VCVNRTLFERSVFPIRPCLAAAVTDAILRLGDECLWEAIQSTLEQSFNLCDACGRHPQPHEEKDSTIAMSAFFVFAAVVALDSVVASLHLLIPPGRQGVKAPGRHRNANTGSVQEVHCLPLDGKAHIAFDVLCHAA